MKFNSASRYSINVSIPMSKLSIGLIFGGKSTEHDISKLSANGILSNIDQRKYDITLIKIDIEGNWSLLPGLDTNGSPTHDVMLTPGKQGANIRDTKTGKLMKNIDVAFPILHGVFGEDGTIQGLFKMINIAFVGCGVFASSACMDKDFTKRILRDTNIAIAPYVTITQAGQMTFDELDRKLGAPLFIKPASLGSSVGVKKVHNAEEFEEAVKAGLEFDVKIIVEPNIEGREIECAVLGNEKPKSSLPGEIVTASDFYSFESKYVDKDDAQIKIPAELPDDQIDAIRQTAVAAFKALGCEGLARVDFFVTSDGTIMINEINTIPGFTPISMYPKMWEATGISYTELIDHLIELGLERHQKMQALKVVPPESL